MGAGIPRYIQSIKNGKGKQIMKCWSCARQITGDSQDLRGFYKCEGCGWISSYRYESPIQSLDILKVERELLQ
jgi:hypothetical protein